MDPSTTVATAACGAYLLVAIGDARLETLEETRFFGGVVNEPEFQEIDAGALTSEYARLHSALIADYPAGEAEVLAAIASVSGDASAVAAVKMAVRHAIIADQKLKPQEDLVISRIAHALGLVDGEL